jgi:phage terminase small subunit
VAKLTDKQRRFVSEYLIDLNATRAALRAGYSAKNAESLGCQLLKKTQVQEAITEAQRRREVRTEITQDRVLKELARIAFFDPRKLYDSEGIPIDIEQLDADVSAVIAGLKVERREDKNYYDIEITTKEYKLADKLRALEALGKHLGMFKDRGELQLNVSPIKVELTLEDKQARLQELLDANR